MAELIALAGPLSSNWRYGFRLAADMHESQEIEITRWCTERFGHPVKWDDDRADGAAHGWSRWGPMFLFSGEDMAFEFRMRWT